MAEQMFLVEARRERRGDQPAGIARFILTAGSQYAALSKLRVYYDTSDVDSLTAVPVSGVVPIAGAMVHDMVHRPPDAPASRPGAGPDEGEDDEDEDDEDWKEL